MILDRVRRRRATRRRNQVVEGLLQSLYAQSVTGSLTLDVPRESDESDEEHASRELVLENQHKQGALTAISLMLRNELAARGLLSVTQREIARLDVVKDNATATLKRTVVQRPE